MIFEKERLPVGIIQSSSNETRFGLPERFGRLILPEGFHLILQGEKRRFLICEEAQIGTDLFGRVGYDGESVGARFAAFDNELVPIRFQALYGLFLLGELLFERRNLPPFLTLETDLIRQGTDGLFLALAGETMAGCA